MTRQAKAVLFTPSTESASSDPFHVPSSSDDETPSPIPANRASCGNSDLRKAFRKFHARTIREINNEVPINSRRHPAIDISNDIATPCKQARKSRDSDGESSSRKRQRTLRRQGQNSPIYSVKWHPIDDTIKPKRTAKVKANIGNVEQNSRESDSPEEISQESIQASGPDLDEAEDEQEQDNNHDGFVRNVDLAPSRDRRRPSRTLARSDVPNYDMKFHLSYDKALLPVAARAATKRNLKGHRSRRESAETDSTLVEDGNSDVLPDADIVNDERSQVIAPPPAAKLSYLKLYTVSNSEVVQSNVNKPSSLGKNTVGILTKVSSTPLAKASKKISSKAASESAAKGSKVFPSSIREVPTKDSSPMLPAGFIATSEDPRGTPPPPAWSSLQNPYLETTPLDYDKLELLDQLIYSLQKGAPTHGKTLPLTWEEVKEVLFEHGNITLDERNSREGTEWLKARYEGVRLGIEAFFGNGHEPKDNNGWTLLRTEGFDAFDKKRGTKYWKHYRYSIVSSTTTTASYPQTREVAKPDDEDDRDGGRDDATVGHQEAPVREDHGAGLPTTNDSGSGDFFAVGVDPETFDYHGGGTGIYGAKSTIIDLEDGGSAIDEVEQKLVESMQRENLSSEVLMGGEELEDLRSPIERFPPELHNQSEVARDNVPSQPNSSSSDVLFHPVSPAFQPYGTDMSSTSRTLKSPFGTQATPATVFLHGFKPNNKGTPIYMYREDQGLRLPPTKTKKRKSRAETEAAVEIYEDDPGGSPRIRKIVANNPPSPGTDVPKENLHDEGTVEHSSQVSVRTPSAQRYRQAPGSPVILPLTGQATAVASPYRSLFGGPAGTPSPST